jgi:hypothetical protein
MSITPTVNLAEIIYDEIAESFVSLAFVRKRFCKIASKATKNQIKKVFEEHKKNPRWKNEDFLIFYLKLRR